MDRILESLNPSQREAVLHGEGPCLVLAGAGSGKTRVLTHRIAYLIGRHRVPPRRILAVTFTNKAAGEMKKRVVSLLGSLSDELWVSTFHSFCVRVLRRWAKRLGFDPNFSIYDRDDQKALIKTCLDELQLDPKRFQVGTVLNIISGAKNRLIGPEDLLERENTFFGEAVAKVYALYQKKLRELNALDFDDLLFEVLKVFNRCSEIVDYYNELFVHILVDEFQDTNRLQYLLVKKLTRDRKNIFVVGDDDQSIYGWRGAEVRNILDFPKDFPGTRIIKLEKNYRSTKNIVSVASRVIALNRERWGKNLYTDREPGEPVYVYPASDEHDEARFVAEEIERLRRRGYRYRDIAVLYRVNAQSRVLEEELLKKGIPHKIFGGIKFYERKEIKDIIAYLRFIVNPSDEVSFLRVVNVPPRGIGKATLSKLREVAEEKGLPLPVAFTEFSKDVLKGKALKGASVFEELLKLRGRKGVYDVVEEVLRITGYREYIESMGKEEIQRLENIQEFLSVAREFEEMNPEANLSDFMEFVGLMTDVDTYDQEEDRVTLMTVHSAKGLEFPVVFVVGLEEGLLPLNIRFYDQVHAGDPEEETRLCYVAMTRAKEVLYLTYATERLLFGKVFYNRPSRYVRCLSGPEVCYIASGEDGERWFQSP